MALAFLKQHASCGIQQFACIYDILWYTGYNVRMTYMWGIDCNTCFSNIVLWVLWFVCMNRDMFCIGDMYVTNKSIFVIICWNDFLRLRGIDMNWWCHIYPYLPLMYTYVCSTSQICLYKGIYSNQRAIAFLLWTRRACRPSVTSYPRDLWESRPYRQCIKMLPAGALECAKKSWKV